VARSRRGLHPPRSIAPLHVHRNDDEAWYLLDGELSELLGWP
jgi:uncharacterized cupin superfamily protein